MNPVINRGKADKAIDLQTTLSWFCQLETRPSSSNSFHQSHAFIHLLLTLSQKASETRPGPQQRDGNKSRISLFHLLPRNLASLAEYQQSAVRLSSEFPREKVPTSESSGKQASSHLFVEDVKKESDVRGPMKHPDHELVRDCVFAIQGVDGDFVKWDHGSCKIISHHIFDSDNVEDNGSVFVTQHRRIEQPDFRLKDERGLFSRGQHLLVARICQLGRLYKQLCHLSDSFPKTHMNEDQVRFHAPLQPGPFLQQADQTSFGLIVQSFYSWINCEINQYYRSIALLESQLSLSLLPFSQSLSFVSLCFSCR